MKYNVLYVDPPWSYNNKKTGGSLISGSASKYPTMTQKELLTLDINKVAMEDSILFMWATTPLIDEAFLLMNTWGYAYKTMITWEKTGRLGMGFWFRVNTEHLLVGVRGEVKPFRCSSKNILSLPTSKHSRKPPEFRTLIEKATTSIPNRSMLEMFAREVSVGWECWGTDIDGVDIRDKISTQP